MQELTQEQISQLKSKGLDDAKIASLAKENGFTLPKVATTNSLTRGQIAELKARGLTDDKISTLAQQNNLSLPKEIGGFQSFTQAVAKPFLKIASSIRAIPETIKAKTPEEIDFASKKPYSYGYFGEATPISGPKEAIGVGAEIGSYAIGGGGGAKAVGTGLSKQLLKATGEAVLTGATSGGVQSFGSALQDAENKPSDIAYKTLFGTAVGGGAGLVLGPITPIVAKAPGFVKRFTNINQINDELTNLNTQVFKPTPKQLEKWSIQGKDPMRTYTEIFGTKAPEVGKDNRFTREAINDLVEKVDSVYKPSAEGFNTILRNSPEVNSISKARDMAVKNLEAFNLTPEMEQKAIAKIDENFNAIKAKAKKDGVLLGDDSIPVYYTDNLKDRFWGATRNFGTEDATIANSVNSSIGHGFKDSIENVITDINVKNYNKKLGDLIVLRDFLETKTGALAGTGGKMTRLMGRVAGTVAGSQGGPIGSIIGNLTGDKLAQIMIDPSMQPYRWLVNKKLQQLPPAQVLKLQQEADEVLKQMFLRRQESMVKYALPEANRALAPEGKIGEAIPRVITPPSPTTFEPQAQNINTQPLNVSDNIPPTTNPTTNVNTNAIIPESISQVETKNINDQLIQEAKKYKSAEEFIKKLKDLSNKKVEGFRNTDGDWEIGVKGLSREEQKLRSLVTGDGNPLVDEMKAKGNIESQLTDIWNKANKEIQPKNKSIPTNEGKITKGTLATIASGLATGVGIGKIPKVIEYTAEEEKELPKIDRPLIATNYDPYAESQTRKNPDGIGAAGVKIDETMVATSKKEDNETGNLRLGTVIYVKSLGKPFLVADLMNERFNGIPKIDFATPKKGSEVESKYNKTFGVDDIIVLREGSGRKDARDFVESGEWDKFKKIQLKEI